MSLSKCQGVRTQASTVLPGRVGTSPTENRARAAHGQPSIPLLSYVLAAYFEKKFGYRRAFRLAEVTS